MPSDIQTRYKAVQELERTFKRCVGCGLFPHRSKDAPDLCHSCTTKESYGQDRLGCPLCDRFPFSEGSVCSPCASKEDITSLFSTSINSGQDGKSRHVSLKDGSKKGGLLSRAAKRRERALKSYSGGESSGSTRKSLWLHANIELLQIDNAKKECVVQGWLDIAWQDNQLAHQLHVNEVLPSQFDWLSNTEYEEPINPHYLFKDAVEAHLTPASSLKFNLATGVITWSLNFKARLPISLNLQRFPFDRQHIQCLWTYLFEYTSGLSRSNSGCGKKCSLVQGDLKGYALGVASSPLFPCASSWNLPSWMLKSPVQARLTTTVTGWIMLNPLADFVHRGKDDYGVRLALPIQFYLTNILIPMFIIVLFSGGCFLVIDLASRMSISLTVLLTAVAFKFAVGGTLPPTTYLTILDWYFLSAFGIVLLVAILNIYVYLSYVRTLVLEGDVEVLPYPQQAARVDEVGGIIFCVLWVLEHLLFWFGDCCGCFRVSWRNVKSRKAGRQSGRHSKYSQLNAETILR